MKPNILLVTADQWRGDCLSALAHACVRTPNLDALAAEGTLFARHYAGAAPCSPARASLYTGLYPMNHRVCQNGSPLDARFDTLARLGRRAGYDPTLFGYTDTAPDPRGMAPGDPHLTSYEGVLPGFSVRRLLPEHERPWLSWLRERGHADATDRSVHRARGQVAEIGNGPPAYGHDETQTAFLTDEFLRWHGEQDEAWFAHLSFLRPHPPFVVPGPYNAMFSPEDGPAFLGAGDRATERALHPYLAWQMAGQTKGSFVQDADGRVEDWDRADFAALRAVYYGMIAEVDAQIGRICQTLRQRGDWENTLVVFCSDHGEMAGDHWLLGKGGFFEASYHIPLIIRDPASAAEGGRQVFAFTSAADILPTLAARLGIAPGNHQDGASLLPFLNGAVPAGWRDAAFWEFDFRDIAQGRAEAHFGLASNACNLAVIRDEAWKYVHFAGLPPLLFDLANDPGETRNLAGDPAHAGIRLAYAETLLSLRARHLDQTLAYTHLGESGPVTRRPGA
ncbi:alkaline phosphatase family protein [Bosea sp. 124]|uniref:alkaline phosphatase family protein n=1 Tax=Bosea sp. 124 TaxID=2135642 RepID=UPI000D3C731B|nr:alkaline phosphatase family protein [Bosea sp. 124]PTM39725.1 arylsulfatase A-like enzyme [Bosea sp. 124]